VIEHYRSGRFGTCRYTFTARKKRKFDIHARFARMNIKFPTFLWNDTPLPIVRMFKDLREITKPESYNFVE
jgi:hypothetical protein